MPAVGAEAAAARDQLIDGARDADGDALETGGQSALVARFDDEVQVVSLHGKVNDSEGFDTAPRRGRERNGDGGKDEFAPERAKERTHRDVNGMRRAVPRAGAMRNVRARSRALSPGALAAATPRGER